MLVSAIDFARSQKHTCARASPETACITLRNDLGFVLQFAIFPCFGSIFCHFVFNRYPRLVFNNDHEQE